MTASALPLATTADPSRPAATPGDPASPPPPAPPRRRGRRLGRPSRLLTIVLALASLTVLAPLYVTVAMAFKTSEQSVDGNAFSLPAPFDLSGFAQAWELTDFPRSFGISVLVAALSVAGTLLLASTAAYAISRNWDRRVFRWSFFLLLAAMFIPFPVIALPQIQLTAVLGVDSPFGVAILHVMFQLSFSVLLFTAFLRSLPDSLEESARIDGATTNQIFWRIVLPLLAPMSATVGIFAFLASWNDFMMPSLIIADPTLQTLPVVQSLFQSDFGTDYNVAFASYLMAMAPTILVFALTQRWVVSGITQGAVKQ